MTLGRDLIPGDRPRPPVVGLILAGGASRRMGSDKAALDVGGVTMLERTVAVLGALAADRLLIVGGDPGRAGSNVGVVDVVDVVDVVADRWPGEGPLGGLVTGLAHLADRYGSDALAVVVSCDLPLLRAESLSGLVEGLVRAGPTVEVAASVRDGRRQPLHAVYRLTTADSLAASFLAGNRRLDVALDGLAVVERTDSDGSSEDVDTPDDWRRLRPKADAHSDIPPRV